MAKSQATTTQLQQRERASGVTASQRAATPDLQLQLCAATAGISLAAALLAASLRH